MEKVPIRSVSGKICGYIQIDDNGDKRATDNLGKILGYYKAKSNTTVDVSGRILARGDVVSSLIRLD